MKRVKAEYDSKIEVRETANSFRRVQSSSGRPSLVDL